MEKKERKYKKRQMNALQESKGEEEEINHYSTESKNSTSDSQTSEEKRSSEDEQINCFFTEEIESESDVKNVIKPVEELMDITDLVTDSDSGSDDEYNDISDESGQTFTEESDGECFGTIGIQTMVTKEKEEKSKIDYKRPKGKDKIPVDPNLFKKKKKRIMQ